MFYSITNCQEGLRGVAFGSFLIKQVVEDLRGVFPRLLPVCDRFTRARISVKWLAANLK